MYLFHIKTWNFLYKNPRLFYSIFLIATIIANKPLSDCITSLKTILPFHFSPKPTAEGETKRQHSKQLSGIVRAFQEESFFLERTVRTLLASGPGFFKKQKTRPPGNAHYTTCFLPTFTQTVAQRQKSSDLKRISATIK